MDELAAKHGLEALSFERPHVQLVDWKQFAGKAGPKDEAGWLEWLKGRAA